MYCRLATLTAAIVLLVVASTDAHAQRRVPGYLDNPPISPYLSLFRSDRGGLDAYYAFFRPQQQMRSAVQQQQGQIGVLQQSYGQASGYQQGFEQGLQQRPATSTGQLPKPPASFMNMSHYYLPPPMIQRRR